MSRHAHSGRLTGAFSSRRLLSLLLTGTLCGLLSQSAPAEEKPSTGGGRDGETVLSAAF